MISQPESIEAWKGDRVYLTTDRIHITHTGAFICNERSHVRLHHFAYDCNGLFIQCSQEEAQEHFDKSREALFDGIGHSMASGVLFAEGVIPLGVYEGYKAMESFKDMGKEYSEGMAAEGNSIGTMDSPRDSKD